MLRTLMCGSLPLIGLCAALAAAPAQAQSVAATAGQGEIVVTAQRRAERSVDVPITVTTLRPEQLTTANVEELSDIARITPSLRFDNQAAFSQPTIRGIGTAVVTSGGGANVGIYVDGFYSPNPLAADFQLSRIESIQVLKGPQGTLFGRNTTGGAILVETADPSTDSAAEFRASYGRFDQFRGQGYATFGLAEGLAVDVEGLYRRGDNFQRNVATGRRDADYENWSVRLGLKADFSDAVSLLLRYTHSDIDDPISVLNNSNTDSSIDLTTGAPFGVQTRTVPGTFSTDPDRYAPGPNPRFFRANADVAQATVRADLGFAELASYSQYRREDSDLSEDLDQVGLTIFQIGVPIDNVTWSQEFLLTSKPGSRLQWTAGLFYFSNRDTYQTFIDNNVATIGRIPLGGSSSTSRTYAAYADATYEISERLFVTAGARYSHDEVDDAYYIRTFSGVRTFVTDAQSDAAKGDRVTPRVVLRYKPSEQSSVYASYSRGYKAAILDVGGATGNPIDPESVDAFEVGFKFDDRRLAVELAGFYYDYRDLQVSVFRSGTAQLLNAAKSEIYGLEGQLRYEFSDAFDVNLGAAWTHARYKRFGNVEADGTVTGAPLYASCPAPAAPVYATSCANGEIFYINTDTILRNVTMQRTPAFTGNIGARYATPLAGGELALSGNLYYTSKFFFGPSGTQFRQGGYEVLALRAEWTDPSDRFSVAVFGDNLTGSRYRNQVQYNNFGIGAVWSQPRTWGLELGARF